MSAAGVGFSSWLKATTVDILDYIGITDRDDITMSDNGTSKAATIQQIRTAMGLDSAVTYVETLDDLEALFDAIEASVDSDPVTVVMGAGEFTVSGQITIPAGVSLVGMGSNKTIFTASGDISGLYPNGAVIFKAGDEPTQISDLSSDVIKGDVDLPFTSAHGLSVGSVILIYNPTDYSFSGARATYRAGEYATVAEVTDDLTVKLESGLNDDYLAADVNVYKCDGYESGTLQGFSAVAPGPGTRGVVTGLTVQYCHKINLHDVKTSNSDNSSTTLINCYKVTGGLIDAHQWSQSPGFSTQYGVAIANCQEVDISGRFIGYRHGITQGSGSVYSTPNRYNVVHDFYAKNRSGSLASADWHGNVEHCVYERGVIFGGGMNIAGNHNRITDIKAHGNDMMVILGREVLGLDHIVENIEVWTGRDDTTRGLINVGGNETAISDVYTQFGGSLIFRNIFIDAPNVTRHCIGVRNRGFVGDAFSIIADNITFIAPNSDSALYPVLSIATVSGDTCERAQATNINTLQGSATPALLAAADIADGCLVRQDSISGVVPITTSTSVTFIDTAVVFPKVFSKEPSVITSPSEDNTGADRCVSSAREVDASGFTARFRRVDTAADNFVAEAPVNISWVASLSEW